MAGLLSAHGYDPGATQRPFLAGALAALLATLPAIAVLILFGSLPVEAEILHLSRVATLLAGEIVMAMAGAFYARLFGRAANDKKGGWLFGMAFGFLLWSAGAVMILPLLGGGRAPAGEPAMGVFLSLVLWGAALGLLLPYIQKPLRNDLERMSSRKESGPSAAASGPGPGPRH